MIEQNPVFIALGANLEHRTSQLNKAIELLSMEEKLVFRSVSSFYETEPVGVDPQPVYLNAVAEFRCSATPSQLLNLVLGIEEKMGRVRVIKGSSRLIDLDILLYGQCVLKTPSLEVPHPRMHERRFVLVPLSEIAPKAFHPILKMTVEEMLETVAKKKYWVKKIEGDSSPLL